MTNRSSNNSITHPTECRPLQWACHAGNEHTLSLAIKAGADPNWPGALAAAIEGEAPLDAVTLLLEHGASPNLPLLIDADRPPTSPTLWPVLEIVIRASNHAPRWCPVPLVQCLLENGAILGLGGSGEEGGSQESSTTLLAQTRFAMAQWARIMSLKQVRGPRRMRVTSKEDNAGNGGEYAMRHDHCVHADPCALVMTKMLLKAGADPNLYHPHCTLTFLAICDDRRPAELLRCLADAGADLSGCPEAGSPDQSTVHDPGGELDSDVPIMTSIATPILEVALENAVLIESLKRFPRGRNWIYCYPAVQCPKAGEVVKYLMSLQNVAVSPRCRMLLDRLGSDWKKRGGGGGGSGWATGGKPRKYRRLTRETKRAC